MKRGIQGILTKITVGEEIYNTYFPNPLPPKINYSEIALLLEKANKSIGELNGVVSAIPDPSIINYMYVRKEAVLSSQ
ncbi:MAG: hypothetical protein LBN20_02990, partial [Endomicrobium sp.]|nr:hypothetical protein [Endomicrobium sp.]